MIFILSTSIVAPENVIKKCAVSYRQASLDRQLEDEKIYPKVKAMLLSNADCCNPLGELIDKKLYSTLSDIEKEKYILDLSKKYNLIREKILLEEKNL